MIGGSFTMTYTAPEIAPSNAPAIMEIISMTIVGSPAAVQIDALMTDESSATEPIEKSNLPLFKFSDNAKVVSITDAAALKNKIQFPSVSNNFTPCMPHNSTIMRKAAAGIPAIPTILFNPFVFPVFIFFNPSYF